MGKRWTIAGEFRKTVIGHLSLVIGEWGTSYLPVSLNIHSLLYTGL
jgi:hypothetical protein